MNLSDFDFDLPETLIATRPARPRSAARLLVAEDGTLRDLFVRDLVDRLMGRLPEHRFNFIQAHAASIAPDEIDA